MPLRTPFMAQNYYHIYNNGLNKQRIFHQEKDYKRFIITIEKYNERYSQFLEIQQRCILPNHFHLLIYNKIAGLYLAKCMMCIELSYAQYFKRKYGGYNGLGGISHVFNGRYKAKLLDTEEYIKDCKLYIQNNPIKHGYVEGGADWPRKSM